MTDTDYIEKREYLNELKKLITNLEQMEYAIKIDVTGVPLYTPEIHIAVALIESIDIEIVKDKSINFDNLRFWERPRIYRPPYWYSLREVSKSMSKILDKRIGSKEVKKLLYKIYPELDRPELNVYVDKWIRYIRRNDINGAERFFMDRFMFARLKTIYVIRETTVIAESIKSIAEKIVPIVTNHETKAHTYL